MTTTTHPTPDALDLAREADRLFQEWAGLATVARRSGDRDDIARALRAHEAFRLAVTRADEAAAGFGLDGRAG